jgi:phage-related protein
LPAIQQLVAWLQEYIPIAIQWLSDYWNNVLYPALLNFWAWVQTYVFPIIELWWEWLQNFIPAAIQFLSNLWSNVLWPALQAVWTWISTVLFPLFVQFYEWLFTTIPEAVSFLQEVWTILVDFWETSLKPLLEALGELLSVTLALAVEALAGLWENVLLPALTAIWEFIQDNLGPIFEKIADYLSTTFGEKLGTAEGFLETLKDVFGELGTKISGVVDWVKDLADRLSKLKLPAFLQRKSPSPFEQTLDGVAQGLRDINRQALPDFGSNLDSLRAPNLAGATPAAAPITVNVNVDRVGSDMDLNNIAYRVAEEISRRQRR